MKRKIYFAAIALVLSAIIYSCAKDETIDTNTSSETTITHPKTGEILQKWEYKYKESYLAKKGKAATFPNIKKVQLKKESKNEYIYEMLHFVNMEDFENTLLMLEELWEINDDDFLFAYDNGVSNEELNDIEEMVSFNDLQPLEDFEMDNGFFDLSLRSEYVLAEQDWLSSMGESIYFTNSPNRIYTQTIFEMTVINRYGEVLIGDSVLILENAGFYVFVHMDNFEVIDALRRDEYDILINDNGIALGDGHTNYSDPSSPPPSVYCVKKRYMPTEEYDYDDGNKYFEYSTMYKGTWINSKAISEMDSYQFRPNGNSRRYRANIGMELGGDLCDGYCDYYESIKDSKGYKKRKRMKAKAKTSTNNLKINTSEVAASFYLKMDNNQLVDTFQIIEW